jgi:hypothetical protein
MTRTEVPVVRKQVVVNAPVEQAFTAFTERFGDFKPPEHNLLAAAIAEHRHLDRHGPGWQSVSDGDQGWPLCLARYAALLEGR